MFFYTFVTFRKKKNVYGKCYVYRTTVTSDNYVLMSPMSASSVLIVTMFGGYYRVLRRSDERSTCLRTIKFHCTVRRIRTPLIGFIVFRTRSVCSSRLESCEVRANAVRRNNNTVIQFTDLYSQTRIYYITSSCRETGNKVSGKRIP